MYKNKPPIVFARPESRMLGLLAGDEEYQETIDAWVKEDYRKLMQLCTHYRIQPGALMFYDLALALAREFIPEPKKRGIKPKWSELNLIRLVAEVEQKIEPDNPARGIEWACKQLAKNEPWKLLVGTKGAGIKSHNPSENLRKAYYKYRVKKATIIDNQP